MRTPPALFSILLLLDVVLGGSAVAGEIPIEGWSTFAPRDEIAPKCEVEESSGRHGGAALRISSGGDAAAFGGWRKRIEGLKGGRTYRFSGWYRTDAVAQERRSVIARLQPLDAAGKTVRPPDFALDVEKEGTWRRVEYVTQLPEKTTALEIELALAFSKQGSVWWDDLQLREEASPAAGRVVRTATIYCRPQGTKSSAESVEAFCALAEGAAADKPDLVLMPEGITIIGNGKKYEEVCEPIPGPTTERLSALARKLNAHICAGIYERDGKVIFNTAVLIGRNGELIGKYRKTHLPREEWEGGISPGDEYPVFTTDFGKVGLLICWDLQFPEPARALANRGAELILLPIWGGSEVLARARAIENSIYLASSSYDMRTFIVDPSGQVLAEAGKEKPVAIAAIDLAAQQHQPWLGDMRTRTWKERRPDLPLD
jgi:predicted amidohydrolase